MQIRIGISGWRYPGWRGTFYPAGLAQRRELEYASRKLNSVEINGSFYSLQRASSYRAWYEQTPDDFVFAVKGSRFITHMIKLKEPRQALANFFASGLLLLAEKLGPILWQFPPQWRYDEERFATFLDLLPADPHAAARLARKHDGRVRDPWTRPGPKRPLRHAFEVRHPSAMVPSFVRLLRRHGAALVFADTGGHFPYAEDVIADFLYLRLHGAEELYASGYGDDQLAWWAERIRAWRAGGEPPDAVRVGPAARPRKSGRAVYVYFDNDAKVHAPVDAQRLAEMLSNG
jgi:uncharacterized protein YecE (DUF72 family)